jgi:hypothetical protein
MDSEDDENEGVKNRSFAGWIASDGDGIVTGELRTPGKRGMGANLSVENSRWGTRGQLVERAVVVQVVHF